MSDTYPAPPDASVWWDVDEITAAALAILRLQSTDVDAGRVRSLVPVVGQAINNRLDAWETAWPTPPPPEPVNQALIYGVVELYRSKDSPPTIADDFTLATGYLPVDPLRPVATLLAPYRRRWGVG